MRRLLFFVGSLFLLRGLMRRGRRHEHNHGHHGYGRGYRRDFRYD